MVFDQVFLAEITVYSPTGMETYIFTVLQGQKHSFTVLLGQRNTVHSTTGTEK